MNHFLSVRYNRLNVTGVFDNATQDLMNKPRCGMMDIIEDKELGAKIREKRFATCK